MATEAVVAGMKARAMGTGMGKVTEKAIEEAEVMERAVVAEAMAMVEGARAVVVEAGEAPARARVAMAVAVFAVTMLALVAKKVEEEVVVVVVGT